MEILDDYLSMTVEHLHVVARVQERDGDAEGAHSALGGSRDPGRAYTIVVRPLALACED